MSLFFCLSGFIIHYVYGEAFAAAPGGTFWRFFFARFSRLYPLFLAFFLFTALYSPGLGGILDDGWRTASYLGLTGTWWFWHEGGKTIDQLPAGLSWSISTEWFFYVAYALCLYRIYKIRSTRVAAALLGITLVSGFAAIYVIFMNWREYFEPLVMANVPGAIAIDAGYANSFLRWAVYISPYARLFEFIGGCLACQLYFLVRSAGNRFRNEAIFWGGAFWLAATFAFYNYVNWPESTWVFSTWRYAAVMSFAHQNVLFAPGIVLTLLGLALGCGATRLLALAPIVFLGEVSYSIYLCHPLALKIAPVRAADPLRFIEFGVAVAIVCIIAVGLYVLIERPAKVALRGLGTWKLRPAKSTDRSFISVARPSASSPSIP